MRLRSHQATTALRGAGCQIQSWTSTARAGGWATTSRRSPSNESGMTTRSAGSVEPGTKARCSKRTASTNGRATSRWAATASTIVICGGRVDLLQDQRRARKQAAADDGGAFDRADLGGQPANRTGMRRQHHALQPRRTQHAPLEPVEPERVQPAQHGWPPAGPLAAVRHRAKLSPVRRWPQMMLDVEPVVEKQPVVQAPVVAGRPARMLVMAVELAERQADRPTGQIHRQEELRRGDRDRGPERNDERDFDARLPESPNRERLRSPAPRDATGAGGATRSAGAPAAA